MTTGSSSPTRLIGNRYQVLRELGHGGMGVVYLAKDTQNGLEVAVKELISSKAFRQANILRFKREIRALQQLHHPNVIVIHDAAINETEHYYVMEYVEGTDILAYARETLGDKPLKEQYREFFELSLQFCDALNYIHTYQYVHRDLKPENILISKHGRLKLMDFGLARKVQSASAITVEGNILGTVRYMAPEQVQGGSVDNRTDLYALGVIFYEYCAGRPPFDHKNQLQVMMDHVRTMPTSPKVYNPELPDSLVSIILKLIEKDPLNRFQDAQELRKALTAAIDRDLTEGKGEGGTEAGEGNSEEMGDTLTNYQVSPGDLQKPAENRLYEPSLCGIESHLQNIDNFLMQVAKSKSVGGVVVRGEEGIGKSLLIQNVTSRMSLQGFTGILVKTDSGTEAPFSSLRVPLTQLIEQLDQNPEELINLLGSDPFSLEELLPNLKDYEFYQRLPHGNTPPSLPIRERLDQTLREMLQRLAKLRPMLLAVDSLDKVDPATMTLLSKLLAAGTNPRQSTGTLALVVALDPGVEPSPTVSNFMDQLLMNPLVLQVNLERLSLRDTEHLILSLLGSSRAPKEMVDLVYQDSGGLPKHVREIIQLLVEQNLVWKDQQDWEFKPEEYRKLDLSKRYQSFFDKVIENLDPSELRVLGAASVLGQRFEFNLLQRLCETPEDVIFDNLQRFIQMHIIKELAEQEGLFRFAHPRFRDQLYLSLLDKRRAHYHALAADLLSKDKGLDRSVAKCGDLAYHLAGSGEIERAYPVYVRAGRMALTRCQFHTAAENLEKALALEKDIKQPNQREVKEAAFSLRLALVPLRRAQGRFIEALQLIAVLSKRSEIPEDRKAELQRTQAYLYADLDQYENAVNQCEQAMATFQGMGDKFGMAESLICFGFLLIRRNALDKALEVLLKCHDRFEKTDYRQQLAQCKAMLGLAYFTLGKYPEAMSYLAPAEDTFEQIEAHDYWIQTHLIIAEIELRQGNLEKARTSFEDALGRCQELGYEAYMPEAIAGLGLYWNFQLHLTQAKKYLEQAIALVQTQKRVSLMAQHLSRLGIIDRMRGDILATEKAMAQARDLFRKLGMDQFALSMELYLAQNQLEQGRPGIGLMHAEKALSELEKLGYSPGVSRGYLTQGEIFHMLGADENAITWLRKACAIADQSRLAYLQTECRYLLAKCYLRSGDFQYFNLALSELSSLRENLDFPLVDLWHADLQANFTFIQGDLRSAERLYRDYMKDLRKYNLSYMEAWACLQLVKIGLRTTDQELLARSLKLAEDKSEGTTNANWQWQYLILRARAHQVLGEMEQAQECMRRSQVIVKHFLDDLRDEAIRAGVVKLVTRIFEV